MRAIARFSNRPYTGILGVSQCRLNTTRSQEGTYVDCK